MHEGHGQEYRHQHQGNTDDRAADLAHGLARGLLGRQAFLGQGLHAGRGGGFLTQQLDFVEGHPQVGVQALLGGGEVATGVDLVAGDGLFILAFAAQQHHAGGEYHDQQADQQHVQGFVPGTGRANHLGAAHGWAISA
ncbi:hypothetical protein D3C75_1008710 [compost metagenome]